MRSRVEIYKSRKHLFVTFFIIVLPFLFLFSFSRLAQVGTQKLFFDIGISFGRLLAAYVIAAVLGWALAVSFYRGKRAAVALPLFDVLQSFPTFAMLPAVSFFWGASNPTVIFFLVITVIWPILFSVTSSLKLIKQNWEEVAEIYGLRGRHYLRQFLWPVSAPGLVTGSVIGLGEGWEALVATEIIVGMNTGLGEFFTFFSRNPVITAFAILGFLILIFSINKLIWFPLMEWSHRKLEE